MSIISCKNCNKEKKVRPYEIGKANFCSYACNAIFHFKGKKKAPFTLEHRTKISKSLIGLRGEKSRRWKKDRTQLKKSEDRRYNYAFNFWKREVRNRDNWKCRISNEDCKGNLETHHILSWQDFPELRYELNNGITLCHYHHPRGKVNEIKMSPYFQELIVNNKQNYGND